MALDPTPWFVGGGTKHSPEVARAMAYAATNGAEGVSGAGDLKVRAQGVPNNTVQVDTGGALLLNRYPGGAGQTYALRNATSTNVQITATGSGGGRTDLLVARILDPQYEGQPPANPNNFDYSRLTVVQGVPAATKTAKELNLGYPAIELAKITIPASTATITNAMLTDMRKLARPNSHRELVVLSGGSTVADLTNASFVRWPNVTAPIAIPEWATHVKVLARVDGAEQRLGIAYAEVQLTLGTSMTGPALPIDINSGASSANPARANLGVTLSQKLPTAYPGTRQNLELKARRANAGTDPGFLRADTKTHVQFDVWFQEVAS